MRKECGQFNSSLFTLKCFRYEKKLGWLKNLLNNTKEDLRETVAAIYGLVAAYLNKGEFEKAVRELYRSLKEKTLEYKPGVLIAIGYRFGRKILCDRIKEPKK